MDFPFFIEILLISDYLHLHIFEANIPNIKIVIYLFLELSTKAKPYCEASPQGFTVDYNLKEMQKIIFNSMLRNKFHG